MQAPVALQLYSVREFLEKDFIGTLRKVKEAGCDAVEFAGNYGGMEAAQLKRELDSIGLLPLSAHISLHLLEDRLEETAAFLKELGTPFAVCSGSTVESDERVAASRGTLLAAAKRFAIDGIPFGYHNHWAEFEVRNGEYILETLLRPEGDTVINAQLDYAWVAYSDVDPAEYTRKWGARLVPPHFKDLNADYKSREPGQISAEVGSGVIDFEAVMRAMRDAGTLSRGIVIEQEAFDIDAFDAVAISAGNIKKWLRSL